MRDDDELRLAAHFADEAGEAPDVGFVERRVHFVQDAERARLVAEDGDQQRQRRHGFFAAGEQQHVLQALARRRRHDVDAGVAGAVRLGQAHFRRAAAEDRVERFGEIVVDGVEGLFEFFLGDTRSSSAMACCVSAIDCSRSSRSRVRKVKRCSHSLNSSSAIMLTGPMDSMRCFISR